jgi:structure-specific endonuclease subunit SLX1
VHIPSKSRITISTQVKRNGQPKKPSKSLSSVLSNLHLLLRVPSFARWPLTVHFFNRDVFATWERWCATAGRQLRPSLRVVTDFGSGELPSAAGTESAVAEKDRPDDGEEERVWGIHALPLNYEPIKDYVAKGQETFEFERQGRCIICREDMPSGEGLHAICTNDTCDGVGHLPCWSRHILKGCEEDSILPIQGQCPKCMGEVHW